MMEDLHILSGLGMPENPKEQLGNLAGEWDTGATLFTVAFCYLGPDKWQKNNAVTIPVWNLLLKIILHPNEILNITD